MMEKHSDTNTKTKRLKDMLLPHIWTEIFAYDTTYRDIYKTHVMPELLAKRDPYYDLRMFIRQHVRDAIEPAELEHLLEQQGRYLLAVYEDALENSMLFRTRPFEIVHEEGVRKFAVNQVFRNNEQTFSLFFGLI